MLKVVRRSAVHGVCAAATLALSPGSATAQAEPDRSGAQAFPALPLPPPIEGLIGIPQTYTTARSSYLALITSEAEQRGLPAALADAVAQVESRYDPKAVGSLGEVGLMQIRPRTAALLGYKGEAIGLAEPETNVRLGVAYLTRAWQLANGDVCRALMKYRGGWGEERMTLLSAEYCRRARSHLAAIGSPLADAAQLTQEAATAAVAQPNQKLPSASSSVAARPQLVAPQLAAAKQTQVEPVPLPPIRLASLGTAEPAGDLGQTRSEASEPKGAVTDKAATRQLAPASRVTSSPIGPSKAQSQPSLVSTAKAEPVKAAEPRTGMLPKAKQGAEAAIWTEPAGRSGQGAPNSICSAEPSPHRAGSPLDASGGHASSSPAISAKPLSLFGGRGRAHDSAQPEEPRWDTGTGIAPPSRAHRAHSDRSPRTAPGCCNGGRGGAQAD